VTEGEGIAIEDPLSWPPPTGGTGAVTEGDGEGLDTGELFPCPFPGPLPIGGDGSAVTAGADADETGVSFPCSLFGPPPTGGSGEEVMAGSELDGVGAGVASPFPGRVTGGEGKAGTIT
jgi:hypothetical protein